MVEFEEVRQGLTWFEGDQGQEDVWVSARLSAAVGLRWRSIYSGCSFSTTSVRAPLGLARLGRRVASKTRKRRSCTTRFKHLERVIGSQPRV